MVFASNLWVFILANSRPTLDAGPRKKIRQAGKRAWLSAYRPDGAEHLSLADHNTTVITLAMRVATKKRNREIITWRIKQRKKDDQEMERRAGRRDHVTLCLHR